MMMFFLGGKLKQLLGVAILFLTACGSSDSPVVKGNVDLDIRVKKSVGEESEVVVVSRDVIENRRLKAPNNDLLFGINQSEMGKAYHWGGAVVGIRATKNHQLNMLKLSATPDFKVQLKEEAQSLSLEMEGQSILALPIVARKEGKVLLDLEKLGAQLNLFQMLSRGSSNYKVSANQTVRVNYIAPTVTFDVQTNMVNPEDATDKVSVLTRWYLKKNTGLSSQFRQRAMTEGVGFFGSQNARQGSVRVYDIHNGDRPIHVYIKNFPDVMKASAVKALQQWNSVFERHTGKSPITYSFLDMDSPMQNLIMAGDVRFNVIEWDVYNQASYEGFGPCIHDRVSGQTFSCSAMIQGPSITARTAQSFNDPSLIQKVLGVSSHSTSKVAFHEIKDLKLTSGKMEFKVHSLDPTLRDEALGLEAKFLSPPRGISALDYLKSYVQSVVAHEFGHNLGLRHNFKASTHANEHRKTSSVMDYLFTFTEHDIHVEEYDDMAIAYGYAGKMPRDTDMYCTDEHVYSKQNPKASVECRRFDFSSKPYDFYNKVITGIVNDSLSGANPTSLRRTGGFLDFALEGIAGYGVNVLLGIPSSKFTGSAANKQKDFFEVRNDLREIYCGYKNVTMSMENNADVQVFEKVFAANTHEFLPTVFPKEAFSCDEGFLAGN